MVLTAFLRLLGIHFVCLICLLSGSVLAQVTPLTIVERNPGQERRVALVIGNGSYQHTSKLPNPPRDAIAIADTLGKLGFEVLRHSDLDQIGMTRAIRGFGDKLKDSDVGLVFYAGHGIQVGGKNYLVPVDAKLAEERDLRFEAIDIELVLEQLQGGARIGLVFLDACRDNPLSRTLSRSLGTRSGSVGSGLAPVQTGSGTLIAYATQPGNVAEDGRSDNSPFTTALVKHMATPGIEARQMLTRVRADVRDLTNGRQIPWDHSSLEKDFYFRAPPPPPLPAPVAAPVPPPSAAPTSVGPGDSQLEALFWSSIQNSTNPRDYQAYLEAYPKGVFAPLARVRANQASSLPVTSSQAETPTPRPVAPSSVPNPEKTAALSPRPADVIGKDQIAEAQRILEKLGLGPGQPDGVPGLRTRVAIRTFQRAAGQAEDGELSPQLLERLRGTQPSAEIRAQALSSGGEAALRSGQATEAARLYELAVALAPDAGAWLALGDIRRTQGLTEGARAAYERAQAADRTGAVGRTAATKLKELASAAATVNAPPATPKPNPSAVVAPSVAPQLPAPPTAVAPSPPNLVERPTAPASDPTKVIARENRLRSLKEMLDAKAITQNEYDRKRQQILSQN
jgi:peptidoglycan hydrolase-like protein with peptidoglycan-binding domain